MGPGFFPLVPAVALALAVGAAPVPHLSAQAPMPAVSAPAVGVADARFAGVRGSIRRLVEANSLPSLAVAVAREDEIVWEEGFGSAELERRIPATPRTPYSLASITKPMTATAILLLAEQGRIDLDRPVND